MYRASLSSHSVVIFPFLVAAALLLFALPFSLAAQKSALHLDGTPADPFLAASGKPVVLVFLRTDYPSKTASATKIRQHEREYGYKLPALRDPQHALAAQAQVQVTPEVAVFDGNHRLVYHGRIDDLYQDFGHARSAATTHDLDDAIQAALSGKTPPRNMPGVGCFIADLE